MSQRYSLTAAKREQAGKGAARSLRRDGKIPAVIYGDKKEPVTISLNSNTINVEYRKGHMSTNLCDLDLDGQKHLVLARDVQLHPVTDIVEHVDFLRVSPNTKIAVMVPVLMINQDKCPGLTQKGVLNITRHELEVLCSAVDIPEEIEVDLAGKEIGDAVKSSNAKLPAGAKFVISDRDFTVATIIPPKTVDEPETVAPVAAAAPAAGAAAPAAAAAAKPADKKGK